MSSTSETAPRRGFAMPPAIVVQTQESLTSAAARFRETLDGLTNHQERERERLQRLDLSSWTCLWDNAYWRNTGVEVTAHLTPDGYGLLDHSDGQYQVEWVSSEEVVSQFLIFSQFRGRGVTHPTVRAWLRLFEIDGRAAEASGFLPLAQLGEFQVISTELLVTVEERSEFLAGGGLH